MATDPTPTITKRKVTMRSALMAGIQDDGTPVIHEVQAVDYVRPEELDAYTADARTRWQFVTVSDEPDAGPGGYDGQTFIPETLNHPLAGQTIPANKKKKG